LIYGGYKYCRNPSIAFDGINYFCVWEDEVIHGANIEVSGTRGDIFTISSLPCVSTDRGGHTPTVVRGIDNQLLVIYAGSTNTINGIPAHTTRIWGRFFNSPPVIATRVIEPNLVSPGDTFTGTIQIWANEDINDVSLNEKLEDFPENWSPWQIIPVDNDGATYNSQEVTWTWSRISTGDIKTVVYQVTVPEDAKCRIYSISGSVTVSFPSFECEVRRDNQIKVMDTLLPTVTLVDYPDSVVKGSLPKIDIIFSWQGSDDVTLAENLVYQYKLEGYTDYENWCDWTSETTKTYTLPSGNYTFKVRAKDEAGNYPDEDNPATAKCSFKVSLPIIIYPNPCYLSKGQMVTIANLPLNSKVYIYTISGELVRTLDDATEITTEGGSATATWDLRNDAGHTVAQGIYIYFVPQATDKKTGKIAIIK
ncbi:T9SS type A sorting domain-containing protein, partial [Candidatus Aerophobetes bacterium]|nr:T9SS type A sorting domain-containing protein [Candidatus Aerophobetes bacterium]